MHRKMIRYWASNMQSNFKANLSLFPRLWKGRRSSSERRVMAKLTRMERACFLDADEVKDHRKWSSWLPLLLSSSSSSSSSIFQGRESVSSLHLGCGHQRKPENTNPTRSKNQGVSEGQARWPPTINFKRFLVLLRVVAPPGIACCRRGAAPKFE
jgi:hypothetical protein